MNTLRYLTGGSADLFWPGVLTLLIVATVCSLLSVVVVLKRMAFVGQGVSHAGFGGVGIAAALGITTSAPVTLSIVLAFCIASAFLIAALSRRRDTEPDTAIGIVLVGAMALGSVLLHLAHQWHPAERVPGWEGVLFGSILFSGWAEAMWSAGVAAIILALATWFRRPVLAWAFDESGAEAMGVRVEAIRSLVLVLITLAIVLAMKVVGVVLATALLVLPAATALTLTDRWKPVLMLSVLCGMGGATAGLLLSFEADWPSGAAVVLSLVGIYAIARFTRPAPARR
ncbi:MAG: metal ABC transporter permease [Phycisphaeraceae bacterium]|nr:metal ABC transporter permease [Phycisphaeraceae bacterium]